MTLFLRARKFVPWHRLTFTDGPDGFAFAGTVGDPPVTGDLAFTGGADAFALAGDVIVQGAMSFTDGADAFALAGEVPVAGAMGFTDGADAFAFTGTAAVPEALAPDALLVQTGLSGAVTAIDEDPASPDGSWLTTTSTSSDCRVSFPTPATPPTVGAGGQTFSVLIRKNASGGNDCGWSLELFEGGASISILATGTTASTAGEVVTGTWNASSLGTSNGSAVECRLLQTSGGTGSPAGRRYIEIGAIKWDVT